MPTGSIDAEAKGVLDEARQFIVESCLARNPVIVLGSGASVRHGLPTMDQLKDAIVTAVDPLPRSSAAEEVAWDAFKAILASKDPATGQAVDLESALQRAPLHDHPALHDAVIQATWTRVAGDDQKAFVRFLADFLAGREPPLARLFRFLLDSQHRRVTVVTPNYDRLAEYAADIAGFCHRTGFGSGHIRTWRDMERAVRFYRSDLKSEERTVDIWKVHGSIDWFRLGDPGRERILCLPLGVGEVGPPARPALGRPVIVPPGRGKYEETHREPYRSGMREADGCLSEAQAFLCVGYGFNDSHLQERLVTRCRDRRVPVVLITRDVTPTARALLIEGPANSVVLARGAIAGTTRVHTPQCRSGLDVEGSDLWDFHHFLDFAL